MPATVPVDAQAAIEVATADASNSRHPPRTARAEPLASFALTRLARHGHAPRPAPTTATRTSQASFNVVNGGTTDIEPAAHRRRPGVTRLTPSEHNAVFCKVALFARKTRSAAQPLHCVTRPGGFAEQDVMSGAPVRLHAQPQMPLRLTASKCARACAPAQRFSQAARRSVSHRPRPPTQCRRSLSQLTLLVRVHGSASRPPPRGSHTKIKKTAAKKKRLPARPAQAKMRL